MIYTNNTKKAMKLAYQVHKNQYDKDGIPYIYHPIIVAEDMNDEDSTIVALLHDVLEDSNLTIANLKELGFTDNIIEALICLTHKDEVDYFDYIKNIATNNLATKVKIADLKHNSIIERITNPKEKDIKRVEKYQKALDYLKNR